MRITAGLCCFIPVIAAACGEAASTTDADPDIDGGSSITVTSGLGQPLVVTRGGLGTGTVISSPPGIVCGADCNEVYPTGTLVTLVDVADTGSRFVGWKGGGCTGTDVCVVRLNVAAMVEAQFEQLCTLAIARLGVGGGTVTSNPAGISCGTDCIEAFACGTTVQLAAAPAGSTFVGWSNGCSGTGGCTITLVDASTTIGAAFAVCGNGVIEPGEECDDGNASNTDLCTDACRLPRCGDGIVSATEECDDGNVVNGDACDSNCTVPRCGNSVVDPGEQCDDGNAVNGDACDNDCTVPRCGNGILDPGEGCDHGGSNGAFGDACSATCHLVTCGNGVLEQGEECDEGTANNGPGRRCNAGCRLNVCGDGDTLVGVEQCDSGVGGVRQSSANCDFDCTFPICGDAFLNILAGESCDNGPQNGRPGSTCNSFCQLVTCGNGILETGEQCDDGAGNGPGRRCNVSCKFNVCGDGDTLVGVEQCDGGAGGVPHDTAVCDADCTLSVCGDGHQNLAAGEACDDGFRNGTVGSTCDSFCRRIACGNGVVEVGEQCDPGTGTPPSNSAACDKDCTAVVCGDGLVNTTAGELCDDGPQNGDPCPYSNPTCTRCNSTCTAFVSPGGPFCGDGLVQVQFGEQCDRGGGFPPVDSATCDSDCSVPVCGDGHRNLAAGEVCDDGNTNACGSCSATCNLAQAPAAATGSIVTGSGAQMANGDTFTIGDGFHTAVVFEFRKTGAVTPGHILIQLDPASGDTNNAVRDKTVAAINAVGSALDVTATAGATATVQLANDHQSSLGNISITKAVVTSVFVVTGMTGGRGGDCLAGIGCVIGADCASGVCNATTHVCQ